MGSEPLYLLHSYNPLKTLTWCSKARKLPKRQSLIKAHNLEPSFSKSRRAIVGSTVSIALSAGLEVKSASGFDFGTVAPEQSLEEAESGIRGHASSLLEVKPLIDSESWKEARRFLRKSASYVKGDFYTIIQNSPPKDRPQLRKLYFDLFNNVSKLDYAARDKDTSLVLQCYDNIVIALNDILSRI